MNDEKVQQAKMLAKVVAHTGFSGPVSRLGEGGVSLDDEKARRIEMKLAMEDQMAERLRNGQERA